MTSLPIEELRGELLETLQHTNRVVVQAPTGSGKSTQIPQILVDDCFPTSGQVLILQPRRLAARMLAARVAYERKTHLGDFVGYQIRLDKKSSANTRILFMTEGILLRRMLAQPRLDGVSAVILDEFHERHLYGDISLARCLDLQETLRPDLKVLVMSATLDGTALLEYLGPTARRIESAGRSFPVEIRHLPQSSGEVPIWDVAARMLAREFPTTKGHSLVFMPGAYEIQRTVQAIRKELGEKVPVYALHGEMPASDQDAAVAQNTKRKVIVSTNVAETSLTIDGVTLVIDSGLARIARFDPHRGIDSLLIEKISQASAEQRAGRAGRTSPGLCLRLWTQYDHAQRAARELPEIRRMDLAETVLTLSASGITNLSRFRWLDAPDPKALERAETLLRDLGALHPHTNAITKIGEQMLTFPVHPRYARLFLEAERLGCVREAALLAALTQNRSILTRADRDIIAKREQQFSGGTSDFRLLFQAFDFAKCNGFRTESCRALGIHADGARQVERLWEQFLDIAYQEGLNTDSPPADDETLARCILVAFADQVARRRNLATYQCDLVHGRRGAILKESLARDALLLVAGEIQEIGRRAGEVEVQISLATAIQQEWLKELFPEDFSETKTLLFDSSQNRVVIRTETVFRDLILQSSDRDAEPSPATAACLAKEVRERNITLSGWGEAEEQWIQRVNFLALKMPDLQLPPIEDEARYLLLEQFCENATCLRDIKTRHARPILRSWLRPDQAALVDKFAPERIALPGGKTAKVSYSSTGDARISARIQELFGLRGGLAIGGGRIPLTVEILAPNHRPVQVTSDLANFWRSTYPEIKPQLQRRYPKHHWE